MTHINSGLNPTTRNAAATTTTLEKQQPTSTVHVGDERVQCVVGVDDVHRSAEPTARPSTNDGDSRRPKAGRQIQNKKRGNCRSPFESELDGSDLGTYWAAHATRRTASRQYRHAISSAKAAIVFLILLLTNFPHGSESLFFVPLLFSPPSPF